MNTDPPNRAARRAMASDQRRARPRGDRRYLSTASVCERYGGINPRTVARWIKSGRLGPPMKVNGRDYHDEADLDAADAAARADSSHLRETHASPPTPADAIGTRLRGAQSPKGSTP
jgi:hypothetical protein